MNVNGTLILGCGDNPAANLMAGYKCLTSAFRKCRTCMATAPDIQTKVCLHETTVKNWQDISHSCMHLAIEYSVIKP